MKCLILKHRNFIQKLSEIGKNKKKLLDVIKNSKQSEINSLSELTFNILKGNISCSNNKKKILKQHLHSLRKFGDRKTTNKSKRKLLMNGGGFFLSSLIPIAISTIASLIKR